MIELKPYKEVLNEANGEYVNYNALLNTIEWNLKSNEIKERDNHTCQKCKKYIKPISKSDIIFPGIYKTKIRITEMIDDMIVSTEVLDHLEVHHMYYIKNLLPWEYNDALITVCSRCHKKIHENESIKVYTMIDDKKVLIDEIELRCYKCNGEGFIKSYSHIQSGLCFTCRGNKVALFYKEQI